MLKWWITLVRTEWANRACKTCYCGDVTTKAFISLRNPDEDLGGVMVLGGSDPTLYEGEMTYVNVDAATYWQITMDG